MKLMELYQDKIIGAISGLDRIRFRGTLRWLASTRGLSSFMGHSHMLLKDFGGWVEGLTARIRDSCRSRARDLGIETQYLTRSGLNKENLARQIAMDKGITAGSICMFSVVEPCLAPMVKGNKASKKLEVTLGQRKCVWVYHYFDDPALGFGHVRLQSWVPFTVFICLNGRHWLERQLQQKGIGYVKDGNCFIRIEDMASAQALLHGQLASDWSRMLSRLVLGTCPALSQVLHPLRPEYYWSADETEWATDILFTSQKALDALYPSFLHHGMQVSDSGSVLRYLGRCHREGAWPNEVISDYRRRYEGVRVKHRVNGNSVKMYNKSGSILRIETTITNTREFKVFRHPEDNKHRPASWQKMRKGVSDLHRRCVLSDQCNERYADALACAQVKEKLQEVMAPACNRIKKHGQRYRGLNPWYQEDHKVLAFLARGENAIAGFRNKDLRHWLYPESDEYQKQNSGRTTRRLRLLRAHGLIKKVAKENRYVLTAKGRKFAAALMSASAVDIKALTEIAA